MSNLSFKKDYIKNGVKKRIKKEKNNKLSFFSFKKHKFQDNLCTVTIKVPIPIKIHPIKALAVNSSCKNIKAKTNVIITLNLSIGTTFDASPICNAL